jgi:hypothetical protein
MRRRSVFEIYLRTGKRVASDPQQLETKFNPWHDPDDGRFTFANQGRYFGRGALRPSDGAVRHARPATVSAPSPARASTSRPTSPARTPKPKPLQPGSSTGKPGPNQNAASYLDDLNQATQRIQREMGIAQSRLRSVPGYPETGASSWRVSNDRVFVDAANKFNGQHKLRPGHPKYIDPLFLKSWAMVESGGSKSAFLTDPLQVNVPGDWVEEKVKLAGLKRGQKMTPAPSADAALRWLEFKGYFRDKAGKPGPWIGFERALRRYNGRTTLTRVAFLIKSGMHVRSLDFTVLPRSREKAHSSGGDDVPLANNSVVHRCVVNGSVHISARNRSKGGICTA